MKSTAKSAATPAPAPKTGVGIKKINLGGIIATSPKNTGKEYPALPDPDGEVARLVTEIVADQDALDALDASIEIKKGELRALATPFYFERNHGLHEIPSSIEARNAEGKSVLVAFQNRYTQCSDDGPLIELLGGERAGRFFRQAFELKIAGDKVPEAAVETLIAELQELFARHNASEALSAKATIKPTADFHAARHSQLTVEENLTLEKIVPIVVQVKTKGREKKAA
ncbi:MAG: hypothetical protein QOE70_949 [Chthoniobacter sp.]|jgi:hypothetical protein|nr:hypothetical protein [Chthoniobacter sp.]